MEFFGILFNVLNAMAFYIFTMCKKTDEEFENAESKMRIEFKRLNKESAKLSSNTYIEENQLENILSGLTNLHFNSILDHLNLDKMKNQVTIISYTAIIFFSIALLISILGYFFLSDDLKVVSSVVVPFLTFLLEISFLFRTRAIESRVKKIRKKYWERDYKQ